MSGEDTRKVLRVIPVYENKLLYCMLFYASLSRLNMSQFSAKPCIGYPQLFPKLSIESKNVSEDFNKFTDSQEPIVLHIKILGQKLRIYLFKPIAYVVVKLHTDSRIRLIPSIYIYKIKSVC